MKKNWKQSKLPWEGEYNYNAGNNKTWLEIMEYANVPQWYIDSLCKAYYLTHRAHVAYDTKLALTMAWFKVHYLEAFYRAVCKRRNVNGFAGWTNEELQQKLNEWKGTIVSVKEV